MSLGLTLPLAVLVAFRAGKMWWLTESNYHEKVEALALKTLRGEIQGKLQDAFDLYLKIPTGQHYKLPGGSSMDPIAWHLHSHLLDLHSLQAVYQDLAYNGISSPSFHQALTFAESIFGTLT